MTDIPLRLAVVVSHPIQYYAPLYRRLAARDDVVIKVFFTWHSGVVPIHDRGFGERIAWDIPLTDGYEFESVPNVAHDPGTHHFFGLRNPGLVERVMAWNPDAVHITGWAWASHLAAMNAFHRLGVPSLFRGDSHLLDAAPNGLRSRVKRAILGRAYAWPSAFLVVGQANRAYYESFGVSSERLIGCPHSIDVGRFAEPASEHEAAASEWRRNLRIADDAVVLLFAGKFERKKQPLALMRAVNEAALPKTVLLMVGGGAQGDEVNAIAAASPTRFRVLPFQNQSRMPIVYRLGDVYILPSAYGETWGLGVNEALACGRPALVSDRVGCARDVVDSRCGRIFPFADSSAMIAALRDMTADRNELSNMKQAAVRRAWDFDVSATEAATVEALRKVMGR